MFRAMLCVALVSSAADGRDMSQMSAADAYEELSNLGAAAEDREFVLEAIKHKRLDILAVCLDHPKGGAGRYFGEELEKMPDSEFKNHMLLIILKSPLTNARLRPTPFKSDDRAGDYFAKWFIPMLNKTLPDVPVDYEVISTMEKRRVLAGRMEAALGIESENPENARRVWPPKPSGGRAPSRGTPQEDAAGALRPNEPAPVTAVGTAVGSAPLSGGLRLWAGIAAIITAAAGWFFVRSKSRQT
jgi:hypothetical protein